MATRSAAFNFESAINSTDATASEDGEQISTLVIVLRTIFITFDAVFTMISNPFCIVVIRRTPTLSDSGKVFMITLAMADFFVGVIAAFSVVPAATGVWFWGELLCAATSGFVTIFCLASVSFLVCLSVDRMIAVTRALHYPCIMTQRRAVIIAVTVWIASVMVIGGTWVVSPPVKYSNYSVTCAWQWNSVSHVPFASVVSTCFFILPSSVLSVMYSILFNISRKHSRRIAHQAPTAPPVGAGDRDTAGPAVVGPETRSRAFSVPNWLHGNAANAQRDRKATKMLVVITIAFTIAWAPYSVSILYSSIRAEPFSQWMGFLITWLALSNSWFNVIIYVCMNRAHRQTALRLLKKRRCLHALLSRCCSSSEDVAQVAVVDQQSLNALASGENTR